MMGELWINGLKDDWIDELPNNPVFHQSAFREERKRKARIREAHFRTLIYKVGTLK